MIVLLIATFAVIALIEVPRLIKKKYWRELIAFSVILTIAFVISVLQLMHIEIPNPVKDSQFFIKSLFPFGYD